MTNLSSVHYQTLEKFSDIAQDRSGEPLLQSKHSINKEKSEHFKFRVHLLVVTPSTVVRDMFTALPSNLYLIN